MIFIIFVILKTNTMKRVFTLIFLLLFALQSFGQQRIRVTDFGAKPGSGEDTSHAFQRAVEACGGKNAIIEFPKGRYDFWQEEGCESSTAMHLHAKRPFRKY